MTKPIIRIHDLATDEVIDREMTDAEYAELQAQQADLAANEIAEAQAATDKAALLTKLGITADEARLLLGGN
jgi:predicted metal-binding transcription factor (methanogenesis marker protein 9)